MSFSAVVSITPWGIDRYQWRVSVAEGVVHMGEMYTRKAARKAMLDAIAALTEVDSPCSAYRSIIGSKVCPDIDCEEC